MKFDLLGINRKIGDLQRLQEIIKILVKHGYGHYIRVLNLDHYLPFGDKIFKKVEPETEIPGPDRLRIMLEELGPTFVKFGQLLSLRTDVVPPEVALELEKLQAGVRPLNWEEIDKVIEAELAAPRGEVFRKITQKAEGSASLAQAHCAELKDGREVMVKIQRPGIEKNINRDIELMRFLASLMEKYMENAQRYQPGALVEEFAASIKRELNFVNEAINIRHFKNNFETIPGVKIPAVYWEYTTRRLLVMEQVEGDTLSTYFQSGKKLPADPRLLARRGAKVIMKQVFVDGFFHGDPHPGNIIITPKGELAFIDFGIVGRLDEDLMDELTGLLLAVKNRDSGEAFKIMVRMGLVEPGGHSNRVRRHLLQMMDKYFEVPFRQIKARDIFSDLNEFLTKFDIKFPPEFYLLLKAIITVESVAVKLDPDFELAEVATPYLVRLVEKYRGLESFKRIGPELFFDFVRFGRDLPATLSGLFRKINSGNLGLEFKHRGLDGLIMELSRSSNRLSLALVLAALIVGSSILAAFETGPQLFGYPLLGLTGFLVAGFFGILLVISIFRSKRF
ncbi:MAG: ABC1 kinase family protein [bacterium]